jgi:hypothetical protein
MDEQARFEARAVLAPKRARSTRLVVLVPAVALIATAWAGLSGAPTDQSAAGVEASGATQPGIAAAQPSAPAAERPADPQLPGRVLGLEVTPLGHVEPRQLDRDDVVALSGWYVATAVTSCPPLAEIYWEASLPDVRAADWREFCNRSGVLFASQPHLTGNQPTGSFEATQSGNAGVSVVTAWLAIGIVAPPELEVVDLDSTAVVVVGRFVESSDACPVVQGCPRELMIDQVAWAAG